MIASIMFFVFMYLAAVNTVLARVAGTCTQGDDGHLFGVILSGILYLAAGAALIAARQPRMVLVISFPTIAIMVWQLVVAIRISIGASRGESACYVLNGVADSRGSNLYTVAALWLTVSLVAPMVVGLAYRCNRFKG